MVHMHLFSVAYSVGSQNPLFLNQIDMEQKLLYPSP